MARHLKPQIIGLSLSFLIGMGLASAPASAEVDVNINIGIPLPPAIVVEAPPAMVFLAEPGVYVAVGVPYDLFFIGARYYYFHNGYWYGAAGYGGPWVHVANPSMPPGLRRYKVEKLHEFREHEFRRYSKEGPKYKGRQFRATSGQDSSRRSGAKHEKGRGHGR